MITAFDAVRLQFNKTSAFGSSPHRQEMLDCANITWQRAVQVSNLIDIAIRNDSGAWASADAALLAATHIVGRREKTYNVARIASWRPNPTAYTYTYLWTAHSLYYFWRDRQQLVNRTIIDMSPCLMNVDSPYDVAFGEGTLNDVLKILRQLIDKYGSEAFGECLSAPTKEPIYPRDAH